MNNNEVIADDIAAQIGYFYFEKEINKSVKLYNRSLTNIELNGAISNTCQKINELGITSVNYADEIMVISLKRPGLFIGYHGENIDELLEFIRNRLPPIKIKSFKIHEVKDVPGLFQFSYADGKY